MNIYRILRLKEDDIIHLKNKLNGEFPNMFASIMGQTKDTYKHNWIFQNNVCLPGYFIWKCVKCEKRIILKKDVDDFNKKQKEYLNCKYPDRLDNISLEKIAFQMRNEMIKLNWEACQISKYEVYCHVHNIKFKEDVKDKSFIQWFSDNAEPLHWIQCFWIAWNKHHKIER